MNDIQYLLDKEEIINTTYKYAWSIDTHNWSDLSDVFTDNATATLIGEYINNKDDIIDLIESRQKNLITQHLILNHIVNITGIKATCQSQLQAYHFRKSLHSSPNYLLIGQYNDTLVKTDNGWKIDHKELILTWSSGSIDLVVPSIPIPDALLKIQGGR